MQHDSVAPLPARARKPVSRVTQGSLFTLPRGPFSSCRYQYGLVVTLGLVARILLDVETVAVLVLVATVGLVVWWAAGRSGGARRAETRLRHICFGNAAQVERLIEAEHTRTPGDLSRRSRYARSPAV